MRMACHAEDQDGKKTPSILYLMAIDWVDHWLLSETEARLATHAYAANHWPGLCMAGAESFGFACSPATDRIAGTQSFTCLGVTAFVSCQPRPRLCSNLVTSIRVAIPQG